MTEVMKFCEICAELVGGKLLTPDIKWYISDCDKCARVKPVAMPGAFGLDSVGRPSMGRRRAVGGHGLGGGKEQSGNRVHFYERHGEIAKG